MPCFKPLQAFQAWEANEEGKRPLFWKNPAGIDYRIISVPCGKCDGCQLDRARIWSARLMHEAQMHENNCVITLTYDDAFLPHGGTLVKKHYVDFMKRLREHFEGVTIRFFLCGEYGDLNGRPHYHACLFGIDFLDKYFWRKSESGAILFRSPTLEKLWTFGHSEIGFLDVRSASYIARYCVKKVGHKAPVGRLKEFVRMSRGNNKTGAGGLGLEWFNKFSSDVYPDDAVVLKGGMKIKPPRYYDDKMDKNDLTADLIHGIRAQRFKAAKVSPDNTPQRLQARARVQAAKKRLFSRRVL